jgi:hypothetical protein
VSPIFLGNFGIGIDFIDRWARRLNDARGSWAWLSPCRMVSLHRLFFFFLFSSFLVGVLGSFSAVSTCTNVRRCRRRRYYMASSIAALLASRFPCGQQTGVVVSTIRMGLVIFVYWYVRMPGLANSTVLPLSDEAALIFNVLYIMSGVWVFASSFTVITATFRHKMELQQTALAWNNGGF